VAAENSSTTTIGQAEPFLGNNVIVAPGMVKAEEVRPAAAAVATEDEETLWEGLYSSKNFLGRAVLGGTLAAAWVLVALYTWSFGHPNFTLVTYALGACVFVFWLLFGYKYFRARRNYHYRLTTRRLFFTTGILQRRVDQVELVRVKDLYVRQSLLGSWLDVGTVVLVSSEPTLPKALLLGIEEPRRVMDLIWYHTRRERDDRTSEVVPV
jgi:membrane protein YdbS with pleckstrin-like domain